MQKFLDHDDDTVKAQAADLSATIATNDFIEGINDIYSWLFKRFAGVRPSTVVDLARWKTGMSVMRALGISAVPTEEELRQLQTPPRHSANVDYARIYSAEKKAEIRTRWAGRLKDDLRAAAAERALPSDGTVPELQRRLFDAEWQAAQFRDPEMWDDTNEW